MATPRALLRHRLSLAILALLVLAPFAHADESGTAVEERVARSAIERDLVYAMVGERALKLDLYRPETDAPHPVLVWVHGGGWRRGDKSRVLLRGLTEHGFAVASVEYRLSGEAAYPAAIYDVKAAVRWLRGNAVKLGIAGERVAIGGSSAGGHLAALMGTSAGVEATEGSLGEHRDQSSRVQAVVDLFGPSDLNAIMDDPQKRARATSPDGAIGKFLGGAPLERREVARVASPLTHITKDDAPFLILHGDRDRIVALSQSEMLHAKLQATGVESTLEVLAGSGHGGRAFTSPSMLEKVATFLRKHIVVDAPAAAPVTPSVTTAPQTSDALGKLAKRGPHAFEVQADVVLRDEERSKDLPIRITWPKHEGAAPVLVWSHGLYGSKDAYEPVSRFFASHGWVVIQPTHSDSLSLGRERVQGFRDWVNRPADVHFILDQLAALQAKVKSAGFPGSFDAKRLGFGGHSYGAMTGQMLAGVTTRASGSEEPGRGFHVDARFRGFVLVSPQGLDGLLDEQSWADVKLPVMSITGTRDAGRNGQDYTWRTQPYTNMPAGSKALAVIEGATHRFGGFASRERAQRRRELDTSHIDAVLGMARAFFDAHVLGDAKARALVESDAFARNAKPTIRYEHK